MSSNRRLTYNFALDLAIERAEALGNALFVVETLFCTEPWASDRFHRFVLDGMDDNRVEAERMGLGYSAWVETEPDTLLSALVELSQKAACIITDEFPSTFHEEKSSQLAERIDVQLEGVDSNGLLPMRSADRVFKRAFTFRRFLQANLPKHLHEFPAKSPVIKPVQDSLDMLTSSGVIQLLPDRSIDLGSLNIDPDVSAVDGVKGGPVEASRLLERFISTRLKDYDQLRNHPDLEATSELSPYLHFGHISPHQILQKIAVKESWSPERLSGTRSGQRKGWWGLSESAESFLDELVTWRELGFNMAWQCPEYDSYESLPDWAIETLEEHSADPRSYLYEFREFEEARTHDPLWNAAQRQLVREGRIHNYLRMLWGKKILQWTQSPRDALDVMIELNNKYALDGRNPNSYTGIFWVLGRYDRAWGPERPIFGKIRYMTSENTARKFPVKNYLKKFGV
jgi:deoxyribodipyrimidine photo-lyase